MVGISDFTSGMLSMLINPLIWLLIIFVGIGGIFIFLWWRKKKKLIYPCAEIVQLGNGKTSINFLGKKSAGWFGKDWKFMKLWDSGEKVMRIKDGSIIEEFSEEDFQEVNGVRGIIFWRNPEREMFFPITNLDIANRDIVANIAPATYTEVSADILRKAEEEIKNTWEKILPIIMFGVVVIFALVSVIVITQMVKHGQTEAANLIVKAGETCMENAKEVCSQIAGIASSHAP